MFAEQGGVLLAHVLVTPHQFRSIEFPKYGVGGVAGEETVDIVSVVGRGLLRHRIHQQTIAGLTAGYWLESATSNACQPAGLRCDAIRNLPPP